MNNTYYLYSDITIYVYSDHAAVKVSYCSPTIPSMYVISIIIAKQYF